MLFSTSFKVFGLVLLLPLTAFAAPLAAPTITKPEGNRNLTLVGKAGGASASVVVSDDGDTTVFPQVTIQEDDRGSKRYEVEGGWKMNEEEDGVPAKATFLIPSEYEKRLAAHASSKLLAYGQDQEDSTYWFISPYPQSPKSPTNISSYA